MKRIYIVLFLFYLKNGVTHGTIAQNSSHSKSAHTPQWYTNIKSSISRDSYVDAASSHLQPQSSLAYSTPYDNGASGVSDYNNVVPLTDSSKYYYQIYPGVQPNQQPSPYYQQPSNDIQQYASTYTEAPDEVADKQSFLDGLGNFGGLGNLFSGAGLGGLGSGFGSGLSGLGSGLGGLTGGLGGLGSGAFGGLTSGLGGQGSGSLGGLGSGTSGISSIAGPALAGVFGLKGLGKLGILGTIILLFVLGPVLLILIAFPIAMITLGILAFPVLQLRLPADPNNPRSLGRSLTDTARFARDVLQSEECVERLSCNIANYTRRLPLQGWLTSKLERSQNKWLHRVSRSLKAASTGEDCLQFTCSPASNLKRMFRTYVFGEEKQLK